MQRRTSAKFSIPNPCNMKWEEMNPIDENRKHCSSCDRVIVDFTRMSDGQLLDFFKQHKKVCGQLAPHQLNREIFPDFERKNNSGWKNIFLFSSLIFGLELSAQKNKREGTPNSQSEMFHSSRFKMQRIDFFPNPIKVNIQGTVSDSIYGKPIEGAIVMIHNSSAFANGTTDTSGHFNISITISSSDSLVIDVNKLGYETGSDTLPFEIHAKTETRNFVLAPKMLSLAVISENESSRNRIGGDIVSVISTQENMRTRRFGRIRNFFHRIFHRRH